MKIYIIIFLASASVLTVFQKETFACSCDLPIPKMSVNKQVKKERKKSDAVFTGEVLEVKDDKFSFIVKIKVKSKWKGVKDSEVIIFTGKGNGDCGYPFKVGESYLIYAYQISNNRLSTNICQRTAVLSDAQADVVVLGKQKLRKQK